MVSVLVVALLGVAACSNQGDPSDRSQGDPSDRSSPQGTLALAERNFGVAPKQDPSITYQPDVVIVGGGASSVMSQSNSGLSVVLKADAPHVSDLTPGKIIFVTGRIVGRVVGTKHTGGGVEVYMTPVQLTDVVKDAHIKTDTPVDLAASTVYQGQNFDAVPGSTNTQDNPGPSEQGAVQEGTVSSSGRPIDKPLPYEPANPTPTNTSLTGDDQQSPGGGLSTIQTPPVHFVAVTASAPLTPPLPTVPAEATAAIPAALAFPGGTAVTGGYSMTPVASGGVGVRLAHDKAGVKIIATLLLKLSTPTVHAEIIISHGRITYATMLLRGAAGLHMDFVAGSELGLTGNTQSQVAVPLDFSIPLGGPFPLALSWRQQFILKTAFSARNSTLSAKADYTFGGGLGFTYRPGHFTVDTPGKLTAITDAVDTVDGISVGVNGLVLAYQAKVIIGIGAWGFVTGLELGFNASWGITNGSAIGIIKCRQATLTMTGTVGIGWAIPHLVAVVVNTILSIFKTKIPESGGVRSAPVTIAQRSDYAPQKEICALKPG